MINVSKTRLTRMCCAADSGHGGALDPPIRKLTSARSGEHFDLFACTAVSPYTYSGARCGDSWTRNFFPRFRTRDTAISQLSEAAIGWVQIDTDHSRLPSDAVPSEAIRASRHHGSRVRHHCQTRAGATLLSPDQKARRMQALSDGHQISLTKDAGIDHSLACIHWCCRS